MEMLDLLACIDMIAMGHYPPLIVHIIFADLRWLVRNAFSGMMYQIYLYLGKKW